MNLRLRIARDASDYGEEIYWRIVAAKVKRRSASYFEATGDDEATLWKVKKRRREATNLENQAKALQKEAYFKGGYVVTIGDDVVVTLGGKEVYNSRRRKA